MPALSLVERMKSNSSSMNPYCAAAPVEFVDVRFCFPVYEDWQQLNRTNPDYCYEAVNQVLRLNLDLRQGKFSIKIRSGTQPGTNAKFEICPYVFPLLSLIPCHELFAS